MPFANPYVLIVCLAVAGGYLVTEKVKGPVKAAAHKVDQGARATVRGLKHVVTFGKK